MTQEQIIIKYLESLGEWVKEGLIRGIDTEWGFIGFRGDRTVRDLIKAGKLEKSMEGKYRIVRAIQQGRSIDEFFGEILKK